MIQTRGTLDRELEQVRESILQMGSMVEQAVWRSIDALKGRDTDLAQQIIADDLKINHLRYEIEELCLGIIATQQPVAGDLREIIAAMHITVEMERMGDHAEGIAHLVYRMANEPLLKPLIDVPRMAEIACGMFRSGLDAFCAKDLEAAKAIAAQDDEIDQLNEQVLRELLTYMIQDPKSINRATYLLWVSHNLERIGDRAVNISERVVFMTTGEFKEVKSSWDELDADGDTSD